MAITGEKFLEVTHAEAFSISWHAQDRIKESLGREILEETAFRFFCKGRQLSAQEMIPLGYRPMYNHRLQRGQKSWYFRFEIDGCEFVAVIGEGWDEREYVWTTTYARNRQTNHYRVATYRQLALAALLN